MNMIYNNFSPTSRYQIGKNEGYAVASMENSSSVFKIKSAVNDTADLLHYEQIRIKIREIYHELSNIIFGLSFLDTTKNALDKISTIRVKITELNSRLASGIYNDAETAYFIAVKTQLQEELTSITENTKFKGHNVFSNIDILVANSIVKVGITLRPNFIDNTNSAKTEIVFQQESLNHVLNYLAASAENLLSAIST